MSEGYSKLKQEVQHRETWSHWKSGLDLPEGRELKEEDVQFFFSSVSFSDIITD